MIIANRAGDTAARVLDPRDQRAGGDDDDPEQVQAAADRFGHRLPVRATQQEIEQPEPGQHEDGFDRKCDRIHPVSDLGRHV